MNSNQKLNFKVILRITLTGILLFLGSCKASTNSKLFTNTPTNSIPKSVIEIDPELNKSISNALLNDYTTNKYHWVDDSRTRCKRNRCLTINQRFEIRSKFSKGNKPSWWSTFFGTNTFYSPLKKRYEKPTDPNETKSKSNLSVSTHTELTTIMHTENEFDILQRATVDTDSDTSSNEFMTLTDKPDSEPSFSNSDSCRVVYLKRASLSSSDSKFPFKYLLDITPSNSDTDSE